MSVKTASEEQSYGIGAVAKLTGITDHTIRVWERRYQAVTAGRTSTGRRRYTAADVEKLGLLKLLTERGVSIGQIAGNSIDELRRQASDCAKLTKTAVPERIRTAVLGDFIPGQLDDSPLSPVEVVIADSSRERFEADLARQQVDVIIVETATVDKSTSPMLRDLMRQSGAGRAVLVYLFGRSSDVQKARDANISVLRGPVGGEEILAAVIRTYEQPATATEYPPRSGEPRTDDDWQFGGPIAPRRFNQQQLANLANISSSIDCECPQHLAQLVVDLSAFEVYSANCANRDDDDAALHRYLHQTTAEARALIEVALERVAVAEQLDY